MHAGLVNTAAADTLELTETNVESVLDEIRPYLMADGELSPLCDAKYIKFICAGFDQPKLDWSTPIARQVF